MSPLMIFDTSEKVQYSFEFLCKKKLKTVFYYKSTQTMGVLMVGRLKSTMAHWEKNSR